MLAFLFSGERNRAEKHPRSRAAAPGSLTPALAFWESACLCLLLSSRTPKSVPAFSWWGTENLNVLCSSHLLIFYFLPFLHCSLWFSCCIGRRRTAAGDGLSMSHCLLSTKMMDCSRIFTVFPPCFLLLPAVQHMIQATGWQRSTKGSSVVRPITPSEGLSCWFTLALRQLGMPHFSLFCIWRLMEDKKKLQKQQR